jgi:hypothetical protein
MAERRPDDFPHGDVFSSASYRQDAVNAVVYAFIGVVLLGAAVLFLGFLDSRSGTLGAEGVAETTPLTPAQAKQVGYLCVYFVAFTAAVSFLVVVYSGIVRPLQRAAGMLAHTSADSTDDSRSSISVETTDGTQTFRPDAECVECEETAIGVLATEFVDSAAGEVVPVCPMHLHERRDELEAQSRRVEVETFV